MIGPPSRFGRVVARLVAGASDLLCPAVGLPASLAVPLCDRPPTLRLLRQDLGVLESAIVDARGRLFFTSQTWHGVMKGAVLRMDGPDAEPVPLGGPVPSPGGLAFGDGERLIVGFGDSVPTGAVGNAVGRAGLMVVDPDTGEGDVWVTGLGMANGIACAGGMVYASNDLGTHIDRIDARGTVDRRWARLWSANGLAIDTTATYLYAAQTFAPAAIKRIAIADPTNVSTHSQPPLPARAAMLDGLVIDDAGRLYVAANGAGQMWRVDPNGSICALARGLRCPSAVALGQGPRGFRAGNLYAVTFAGQLYELPL